jgi:hypothetical protein
MVIYGCGGDGGDSDSDGGDSGGGGADVGCVAALRARRS